MLQQKRAVWNYSEDGNGITTDESLPFEEGYPAIILIEEANELAKDHLDLVDRLISDKYKLGRSVA